MATSPIVNDDAEMGAEVLASEIKKVSDAATKLLSSRLTRRCVLILLKDSSGVSIRDIEAVLEAAASLDKRYLKK